MQNIQTQTYTQICVQQESTGHQWEKFLVYLFSLYINIFFFFEKKRSPLQFLPWNSEPHYILSHFLLPAKNDIYFVPLHTQSHTHPHIGQQTIVYPPEQNICPHIQKNGRKGPPAKKTYRKRNFYTAVCCSSTYLQIHKYIYV